MLMKILSQKSEIRSKESIELLCKFLRRVDCTLLNELTEQALETTAKLMELQHFGIAYPPRRYFKDLSQRVQSRPFVCHMCCLVYAHQHKQ